MTLPDADAISRAVGASRRVLVEHIDVFDSIDSTNTWLMQQAPPSDGQFRIALAGRQTAGRGRRGRAWFSPPGAGLYLSIAWTTSTPVDRLVGATLVIGACVVRALDEIGVEGVGLKWPNDIMLSDNKLGGILTESRKSNSGETLVVAGIGINLDLGDLSIENAALPNATVIDLASVITAVPKLEVVAGLVVGNVIAGLRDVENGDTDAYLDLWKERDWLRGRSVTVSTDDREVSGVCSGVDNAGALLLAARGDLLRIVSGSIVLDPARVDAQ